jgi:formate C-acetyltransferase
MGKWRNFKGNIWQNNIDVADFIKENYHEYKGDDSFLSKPTDKTEKVWNRCENLLKEELEKGVLDIETSIVSGINNYNPGYISTDDDVVVGLQTDAPLKRIVNPFGGMRMVKDSLKAYGYTLDSNIEKYFT